MVFYEALKLFIFIAHCAWGDYSSHAFIGEELYVGCYKHFQSYYNIEIPLKECIQLCARRHFFFAAMKGESGCHCGNIVNKRVSSIQCKRTKKYFVFTVVPSYQGCYKDDTIRDVDQYYIHSMSMTNENCIKSCRSLNYSYAATQFSNECFCGKRFGSKGPAIESECQMKCIGNQEEYCGSTYKNSVYAIDSIPGLRMSFSRIYHCEYGSDMFGFCKRNQCKRGWKGRKCEQRDCSFNNGHCGMHKCVENEVRGTFFSECLCRDGFNSYSIYHNCQDVNECLLDPCKKDSEVCVNTFGSYVCYVLKDELMEDEK